jgi:hypothetical protein
MSTGTNTHFSWQDDITDEGVGFEVEYKNLGWTDGREDVQGGDDPAVHDPKSVAAVFPRSVHRHQARAVARRSLPLPARIWLQTNSVTRELFTNMSATSYPC